MTLLGIALASTLAVTACGGSGFDDDPANPDSTGSQENPTGSEEPAGASEISVLIGSSGDSETQAVKDALEEWNQSTGNNAVLTVASDLNQQLSQGFAASTPPDLFYASTDLLAGYVANGSLEPYGDQLTNLDDFYPSLIDNFTVDGTLYCAPKDFSTLALIINEEYWQEAGLTEADIPTDWEGLEAVATKLTTADRVGLTFGPEYQRAGVFMSQAGGVLVDDDGQAAVDSSENIQGLEFVQKMMAEGTLAYPAAIDAGWGGEAFGSGRAAMTIEGNWVVGALKSDYPDLEYTVVELPAGPAQQATLQFTNCWGMAADSQVKEASLELVEFLTSADQQLKFAEAFGPMPSVQSAQEGFSDLYPEQQAFVTSADFAVGMPMQQGANDVIGDFNSMLEGLKDADVSKILESFNANFQDVLN